MATSRIVVERCNQGYHIPYVETNTWQRSSDFLSDALPDQAYWQGGRNGIRLVGSPSSLSPL